MGPCAQKAFTEYWLMMIIPCQIKLNIMHDVGVEKSIKKLCNLMKDLDL